MKAKMFMGYLVTCNEDGSIPLTSIILGDRAEEHVVGSRVSVDGAALALIVNALAAGYPDQVELIDNLRGRF